jgi:hypothetical protein
MQADWIEFGIVCFALNLYEMSGFKSKQAKIFHNFLIPSNSHETEITVQDLR